ncbi:thioesterase [Mycolicibacterium duvalii]|uniref:Thioesterase n=1 Tax=Mycolicibacterium duvalii TaxID=39688 RepID=A0A7I7JWM9_9MYCO|nr:acyl-CoA thioesterase domain-containing protein [Mycolicibacterium duvalii]MCV7369525.1 thioesterase family protein [Mycolicibacterium duvalii]PEG42161.1 thioesterase [Mycolicibacterium duvalii]BBX16246.1 thioesterase [Mycolicibacterium duvalii]
MAATPDPGPAAHFTVTDGGFLSTRYAQSHWGPDHLNGPAVVGLVARALEHECAEEDLQPARLTVDLLRAARNAHTLVAVRVVREGRRVRSAHCDVTQGGQRVAHASLLSYRRSAEPPGTLWRNGQAFPSPPRPDGSVLPYVHSDPVGWTRSPAEHQNDSRKRFFNDGIRVVADENNSPFVRAAMVAEATSLVTNLGSSGIGYINGDLTVSLSRLPVDEWIGIQADGHQATDGIAVGTATLFDHLGPFGAGMTTAVANPAAQIDFSARNFGPGDINYE